MVWKVNSEQFKRALGHLPTGVTVIATNYNSKLYGLTVSSFTSVSLQPSLVLFCIDQNSSSVEAFSNNKFFAVSILADNQIDISEHFAKPQFDKFIDIEYHIGKDSNCPLIDGAVCYIECKKFNQYNAGDHIIVIGEVMNTIVDDSNKPLAYCLREYRELK
ncbi:MAG: flavin reductase family protein [Candidatus Rickettsia vulgarisii]